MSRPVHALAAWGSNVYVGDGFVTGWSAETGSGYVEKWDGVGWSKLGSQMGLYVYSLAVSEGNLYAGGRFTNVTNDNGSVVSVSNVARWDGSSWSALGSGANGEVFTLALSGAELYAGGDFTTAGAKASAYAAKAVITPGNWLTIRSDALGPNTKTLTYVGVPNTQYRIQFATNLTTSPWFILVTNTVAGDGRGTVQDPATTDPQRFYRISGP